MVTKAKAAWETNVASATALATSGPSASTKMKRMLTAKGREMLPHPKEEKEKEAKEERVKAKEVKMASFTAKE